MKLRQITASVVLSFCMCSIVEAQEVKTDSISENSKARNEQTDTLQILTQKMSQIQSRLEKSEKDQFYEKVWKRNKYWKLGLSNPNIERTDGETMAWETEFSVFLQRGRTAYFHSKPLWNMVKFGLDYGFFDISYAKLKLKAVQSERNMSSTPGTHSNSNSSDGIDDFNDAVNLDMHKFEYRLHIGPSISVNPWNHLIVATYFHTMPEASGIVENDKFSYGFGCAMSAGISVSYKAISVGIEGLWSTIKYKQASFDEESDSEDTTNLFNTKDFKLKQKAPRFYIAIRY